MRTRRRSARRNATCVVVSHAMRALSQREIVSGDVGVLCKRIRPDQPPDLLADELAQRLLESRQGRLVGVRHTHRVTTPGTARGSPRSRARAYGRRRCRSRARRCRTTWMSLETMASNMMGLLNCSLATTCGFRPRKDSARSIRWRRPTRRPLPTWGTPTEIWRSERDRSRREEISGGDTAETAGAARRSNAKKPSHAALPRWSRIFLAWPLRPMALTGQTCPPARTSSQEALRLRPRLGRGLPRAQVRSALGRAGVVDGERTLEHAAGYARVTLGHTHTGNSLRSAVGASHDTLFAAAPIARTASRTAVVILEKIVSNMVWLLRSLVDECGRFDRGRGIFGLSLQ